MARKTILGSLLDDITNSLGKEAIPVTKGKVVKAAFLADALESGQSAIEADQQIAILTKAITELQTQNQALKTQLEYSEAQSKNLHSELEAAKEDFRRAQQQDEESQPLSTLERRILEHIDGCGADMTDLISSATGAAEWAVKELIDRLRKSGFVDGDQPIDDGLTGFFLTSKAKAWLVNQSRRPERGRRGSGL